MHRDAFVKYLQENLLTSPAHISIVYLYKRKECGACGHEMHLERSRSLGQRSGNTRVLFFRSLAADT